MLERNSYEFYFTGYRPEGAELNLSLKHFLLLNDRFCISAAHQNGLTSKANNPEKNFFKQSISILGTRTDCKIAN